MSPVDLPFGGEFAHLFLEAFETLVANVLGEELLVGSVEANFRQSQHNVNLLSSTIVHVKYEAEMGNTHLPRIFESFRR